MKLRRIISPKTLTLIVCLLVLGVGFVFTMQWLARHMINHEQYYSSYGAYISGFLGTIFSFFTIVLLIFLEYQRRVEGDRRDDISAIQNGINQNRKLFNSITAYEQYPVGEIRPLSTDFRTIQLSGPEAFCRLNDYFQEKYKGMLCCYYSPRASEFIDSIVDVDKVADLLEKSKKLLEPVYEDFDECNTQVSIDPNLSPKDELKEIVKNLPVGISCLIDNETMTLNAAFAPPQEIITVIKDSFDEFYKDHGHLFGHYLRNQYYVFETIENCKTISEDRKEYYFSLYRSHLSAYELVIMFYNAISRMSQLGKSKIRKRSYRNYIKHYQMLDDLEKVNFIHADCFGKHRYSLLPEIDDTGKG